MNTTAVPLDEQIRSFAAAVRQHLDDLPEEELDDLLGGLGADLAEQAADNGGVLDLGDPADYADELRSAAGIPPRTARASKRPLGERFDAWRSRTAARIRRSPFGAWVIDFLLVLRPVWWVLRGIAAYQALVFLCLVLTGRYAYQSLLPDAPLLWLPLIAASVVSVQWGRGRWLPKNWLRRMRPVASILAIIAMPFLLTSLLTPRVEYVSDDGYYLPDGLLLDGVQVGNIFAFDSDGNPLEDVQLFTGKGTPLNLYGANGPEDFAMREDGLTATVPSRDFRGQPVWNIYPLEEGEIKDDGSGLVKSTIDRPAPPFLRAPRLTEEVPTPSPTPSETPSATPTP